jgi:TPR repeat protein
MLLPLRASIQITSLLLVLIAASSPYSYALSLANEGQAGSQDAQPTKESAEKAAAAGDAKAMNALGDLYYNGKGVPQDY